MNLWKKFVDFVLVLISNGTLQSCDGLTTKKGTIPVNTSR